MPHARLAVLLAAAAAAGCAAGPVPDPDPDPATHDPRFVGRWFVEETIPHALYGASTYELTAAGEVILEWDVGYYGDLPMGHVRPPDDGAPCLFADRWRSDGPDRLVIALACPDDVARDLVLAFAGDGSGNAAGADVAILTVGGEPGWQPPAWGWSFRACPGDDPCRPAW